MPMARFLSVLTAVVALVASLMALALPAYSVILTATAATAIGVAIVALLITPRDQAAVTESESESGSDKRASSSKLPSASELLIELERHKALERQFLLAKQEAEAATMAKGEFLATMSHEIRTPLNGIIPLLELVLSTQLDPDQHEYVTTAYGSARELLRIVDDILDYSKLDAQKLELENVGINLRELTTGVKRLMERNAEAKGLRLELVIDPAVRLAARGDPVRLRQVLTNLISNAIKFTERGSVTLHIARIGETRTRNQLRFEIRDTGIGISPKAASQLFEAFVQADTSTTRTFGGTGLGLAICKRIVTLMGGRIGVNSQPGKGSTFWFEVALDKALGDIEGGSPTQASDMRVLLVTANAAQQSRLEAALKQWGMHYVHASNTQEALARLRGRKRPDQRGFDLVLVDVASIPTTALALHRTLARETRADQTLRVYLRGDERLPSELQSAEGFHVLARDSADAELRARLMALMDAPVEAPAASVAMPEMHSPEALVTSVAASPVAVPVSESASMPDATPVPQMPLKTAAVAVPVTEVTRLRPVPTPPTVPEPAIAAVASGSVAPPVVSAAAAGDRVAAADGDVVLLVEDNPVNRQVAQRLLTLAGIRFESAENGKEALDKMNAGPFAVVLMDCQMPIMDGYTATRRRREHEAGHGLPRLPIVAMTANAMLGDREKCLDAGMDDYMSKPLNRALLESTLRTWMDAKPVSLKSVAAAVAPAPTPAPAPAIVPAAAATKAPPIIVGSSGPAIDKSILSELREIMGAEFVSLVQVFLEDAPLALERIQVLASGSNLAALAAPAHTLKSTSANLGAMVLSAQAKALELDARQSTLRAAPARAAALVAEYERVAAALRKEIA